MYLYLIFYQFHKFIKKKTQIEITYETWQKTPTKILNFFFWNQLRILITYTFKIIIILLNQHILNYKKNI